MKCKKCGKWMHANYRFDTCVDCTWREGPAVHYDGGKRFGTPAEMIDEIKRLRAIVAKATGETGGQQA